MGVAAAAAPHAHGAYCNGERLRCDGETVALSEAMVVTDWGYERSAEGSRLMSAAAARLLAANTRAVRLIGSTALALAWLAAGRASAFYAGSAPAPARRFATTTFEVVRSGSLPAIAASFTLGREDVIPSMFTELVRDLHRQGHADTTLLIEYLERHVEVDGEEHGPMAAQLLANVCGDDDDAWRRAEQAAVDALTARLGLWDGVVEALGQPVETTNETSA